MNIVSVKKIEVHRVETDDTHYIFYTRYGADSWMVTMGESDEPVYDCSKLEEAFQAFKEETK